MNNRYSLTVINMKEFSVAHNVLCNINTTRYDFYQKIYKHALERGSVTIQELIEMGKEAGFTHNMTLDEIIGCLYANFLVEEENNKYMITDRAISDFKIYNQDTKYKYCELPITIDFKDSYIKLLTRPVDTMSIDKVELLQKLGWSRNKSQITLIKKVKNIDELGIELQNIIDPLCDTNHYYDKSFYELLKACGRQRKYLKDYTANLNHRGNYASFTFEKYMEVYKELIGEVRKPVDWGGEAFDMENIPSIKKKNAIGFLRESCSDGMVRELTKIEKEKYQKKYTITGHAYSVITSYLSNFHNNRLSIIIRPQILQKKYVLLVGINSLYDQKILSYLKTYFLEYEEGWRSCSNLGVKQLVEHIKNICSCFSEYDYRTIFDFYNNI